MEKKSGFSSQIKLIGALTTIPILLVVSPLLGYFAGDWVDRKFHIYPWFTLIGLIFGFVAAGRETFVLIKQSLKDDEKKDLS